MQPTFTDYRKRLIERTWTFTFHLFDGVGVVAFAIAGVFGAEKVTFDIILWAALGLVFARILSAPYYIWKEDQIDIDRLRVELDAPKTRIEALRAEKFANEVDSLALRAAALRQRTLDFHNEFKVSGEDRRNELFSSWDSTRRNVQECASYLLNETELFDLSQDLLNRCGIVVEDTRTGNDTRGVLNDVNTITRNLISAVKQYYQPETRP